MWTILALQPQIVLFFASTMFMPVYSILAHFWPMSIIFRLLCDLIFQENDFLNLVPAIECYSPTSWEVYMKASFGSRGQVDDVHIVRHLKDDDGINKPKDDHAVM